MNPYHNIIARAYAENEEPRFDRRPSYVKSSRSSFSRRVSQNKLNQSKKLGYRRDRGRNRIWKLDKTPKRLFSSKSPSSRANSHRNYNFDDSFGTKRSYLETKDTKRSQETIQLTEKTSESSKLNFSIMDLDYFEFQKENTKPNTTQRRSNFLIFNDKS